MPTNNNINYGPAAIPGTVTTPVLGNNIDRAPAPVPPGAGTGVVPMVTAPVIPVTEQPVLLPPTPTRTTPVVLPVAEVAVDATAGADAGTGPNITAGNQQRYLTILANGVVVTNNAATLDFEGNGFEIANLGTNGATITLSGGAGYGNSNVATLLAAFGSNTVSTTGNVTAGNISARSVANVGNLTVAAGSAAWFFGTDGVLTLSGGATLKEGIALGALALGYQAGQTSQGIRTVAIGQSAGQTSQGARAVAVGLSAGSSSQGGGAVAIGAFAGATSQGTNSIILNATGANLDQTTANTFTVAPVRNDVANVAQVMFYNATSKEITYGNTISVAGNITSGNVNTGAITLTNGATIRDTAGDAVAFGDSAGATTQGINAVAVGNAAGNYLQSANTVAVGDRSGAYTQGAGAVAVGQWAGNYLQGANAVAVGNSAGYNGQGINAVAIGYLAGNANQANNSIILNATGAGLNQITANTFTVAPVRNDVANTAEVMFYNATSKEITYGNTVSVAGNVSGGNLRTAGLISATGNITGGNVNTNALRPASGALTISTVTGNLNLQPTTGNIVVNSTYINGVTDPVQDQDVATKKYVDNFATTAITYHQAVNAASTTTMATTTGGTITYTQPNGAGNGVGALLQTTGAFNLIDTANVQTVGTRILVKNEANSVFNGIYTWSNATAIVRATDADEYGANSVSQLSLNDYFFVLDGSVNKGAAYICDAPTGTITFGTSNITFAQFSSSQTYTANTSAGISITGTVINAKVDGTTTAFDGSGNISVKASANLTTPNIGAATGTSLSATGNVTGGNILTGGLISSTGTITGSSLLGAVVSVTANVTGGNVLTGGLISATSTITSAANITGGNITTAGLITATGNVTGGNVLTGGIMSSTGNATHGNLSVTGNITGNTAGFSIGYLAIPQVSLASNVTTALTDSGKHYYTTSASNLALTLADNSAVSWPVGTALSIVNRGTANVTVAPAAGVSLYLAGNSTSANRTVTTYGMATVMNVAANVWMINGTVV